ncbi:MAG TPA: aspartate aminotransferase family protein [Solirubrobacterales bacterium]|jgi:adenosylmethionine-8-amino-7-oxononanoate aminotransferase|nr:aspartate aminotransferase family protein [Solirubrobacterales bacterium]
MTTDPGSLLLHFARNGAFAPGGTDLLVLDRGEGPYVFDTEGRRYIDGLSSLFCSQLGYSHGAEFARVATEQLERLPFNTNWATASPPAIDLAAKLAELAPMEDARVFFTSGGSEAVEAAWKIIRQHFIASGEPQRTKAIARDVAYHGVTLGALSLTGVERFKTPFGPAPIPTRHVANTNAFRDERDEAILCADLLAEVERTVAEEGPETVAAIFAEPLQNAGGCLVPPRGYWAGLRQICDRHGILLVADEVITGMGRLGEWFGVTRFGAAPDVVTIAKGLTSAHAAMGAAIVSGRVAAPLLGDGVTLLHGITFGGHPVAAAIALRNLEIFEEEAVLENVRTLEPHLQARMEELRELPIVGDIRGAGFFWAAELVRDAEATRFDADERERLLRGFMPGRLLEAGLIARADDRGDSVVQIAPPLNCDRSQLDEVVDALRETLVAAGEFMGVPAETAAAG